jgi:hypothetical protein
MAATFASAQTRITPPNNKYSPEQDVKLGLEAAQEVRRQMPMLNDDRIDDYVERIGQRLAAEVPNEFRQPAFRYSFDVVNLKDINAFALPGGPMFVNRGMIEAAKTEGEVAGVMAQLCNFVGILFGFWFLFFYLLPFVCAAGRPAGRANPGAGRIRSEADGEHVRDHSASGWQPRARMVEQPSRPRESLSSHRSRGRDAPRGRIRGLPGGVQLGSVPAAADASGAHR